MTYQLQSNGAYDFMEQLNMRPVISLKASIAAKKADGITAKKSRLPSARRDKLTVLSTIDAALRSGYAMLDDNDSDEGISAAAGYDDDPCKDEAADLISPSEFMVPPLFEIGDAYADLAEDHQANTPSALMKQNRAAYRLNAKHAMSKKLEGRKAKPIGFMTTGQMAIDGHKAAYAAITEWCQAKAGDQRAEARWLDTPIGKPAGRKKTKRRPPQARQTTVRRPRGKSFNVSAK
jgi:hypothetical protein